MRVLCLKSLVQFQEGFTLVNLSFDKLYVNTWQALWDGNKYIASWTYSIGEKLRPRYIQCFIYIVWICKALPQVTYSLIEQQQQHGFHILHNTDNQQWFTCDVLIYKVEWCTLLSFCSKPA